MKRRVNFESRFNGAKLKDLRKAKQLTQMDLAEIMDVSMMSVFYWENNYNNPSFDTVVKLAEFFGVSMAEFVR